ncbi:hypothetical protein [Clostridium botulinum]|uniref:hypothetical protein n=1 Tax=Clostridium botulinum TaxID=1491 RepID=UPI001C9A50E4|nr:hypothetical protein [Clostridium botulinum]MBY6811675.1 hypothetical protein [Clostridium botulinum]MBY6825336.1 hypothetical protein [Clostridium botulinum]MBY6835458.1 hypothetical protein [Clostridium botulinum]MBY6973883.1 hypothetical protein [Clostridium botulinum]MCS6105330.1 hypothetical protein [Clostridium botulinum]
MRKITVYTQSLNHLSRRMFIARIDDNGVISEEIKALNKVEITEEDILEINSIIKNYSEDAEIKIYCLSAYLNKRDELKDKWRNTDGGVELINLIARYNINLHKYDKESENIKNELIKTITNYNKVSKSKNNVNKFEGNEISISLTQQKIYNDNDKIKNIVNVFLRGSCDTSDEKRKGKYIVLISSGDKNKVMSGEHENTTTNRMMIIGLIEALKILKTPCLIRLYTHTNMGFSGGNTNSDLKEELFELIIENNHAVIEIISNEKQEYLQTLL